MNVTVHNLLSEVTAKIFDMKFTMYKRREPFKPNNVEHVSTFGVQESNLTNGF